MICRECLLVILTLLLGNVHAYAETLTPARQLVERPQVLIIAHRGASADYPENTLPAFEAAGEAKADLVELDYYHSKDGVPVVFHDKTLDRTTNAIVQWKREKVEIASVDLATLKQLDVGSWFDSRFSGVTMPTLVEALAVIQPRSMTLIEHKQGDAATCIRVLDQLRLRDQVVVQSFDWNYLKDCHDLDRQLTLGALGSDEMSAARIEQAMACGARVIGWNAKYLTQESIEGAKRRGLRVWAYTVNDVEQAKELIRQGIDGLITDRPGPMRLLVDGSH